MFTSIQANMLFILIVFTCLTVNHAQGPRYKYYNSPRTLLDGDFDVDLSRRAEVRITKSDLNEIISQAELKVKRRLEIIEPSILSSGAIQVPGSHGWFLAASSRTKILAKNYSRSALIAEETSKIIAKTYKLTGDEIINHLPQTDISDTILARECPRKSAQLACHPGKYRSFSGHCNNVQHPDWGNSVIEYQRYLPAAYNDFLFLPRKSVTGSELPSARDVSYLIHQGSEQEHPHITTLMVFFGQFVFHDLHHTAQMVGHRGHRIKCCSLNSDLRHPECLPIKVGKDDILYTLMKQTCLDYVRSCPSIRSGCTLGPRDQTNQVTSFLDASAIYGSSEDEAKLLRSFKGGLLKSQNVTANGNQKELLPAMDGHHDCRSSTDKMPGRGCFYAGDIRVNENVGLTLMHTIWMREHNRIARELSQINPHYTDEQLFQETRRIIAAKLQHIVYGELLPAILGSEVVTEYDLVPQLDGYYTGYNMQVNPGIDNSVASSVMPFLYTLMPSKMERYSPKLSMLGTRKMSDTYFNPSDLYDVKKFDEYMMGLISQNAQRADVVVSKEIANNIVIQAKEGTDLVAAIIQQGRDHGIPGYLVVRKFCAIEPQVKSWKDLSTIMNSSVVAKFADLYKDIRDIDLYTGGLAELPLAGAVVGPTFACLLARQFNHLRRGDRYWYENDLPPSSFTREQLNELRKTTLASVICKNGNQMDFVQPSSFVLSDAYLNAFQYCSSLSEPDLTKWRSENKMGKLSPSVMSETIAKAKKQILAIRKLEQDSFVKRRGIASPKSPVGGHLAMVRPKREALEISNQSLVYEIVTNNFIRSLLQQNKDRENHRTLRLEVEDLMASLPDIDLTELMDLRSAESMAALRRDECYEELKPCDHTTPFRSLSGWCNNLKRPDWGNSLKLHDRLLPPQYGDSISQPRKKGRSGKSLPSPRLISTSMHYDIPSPHSRYALITMQWGQFIDHDMTLTPQYMGPENTILDCRACDSSKTVHPECYPILIPKNDPFFPSINSTTGKRQCLHFVRSINGQSKLGHRDQLNQLTPLLDASVIYGSDPCEAASLRAFERGRLNVTLHPLPDHKELLPETPSNPECTAPSGFCFQAGDHRASEQPSLACMHTIWMREHNKLADQLAEINAHWNDEQIYQTSRKIIGAMIQRITYGEFLPRILGLEYMSRYDLNPLTSGYFDKYDDNCRPIIFNEFASAVFRFGHSLLKPAFQRLGRSFRSVNENLKLRSAFFNSDMLYSAHAIDSILRGIITMSVETLDNMITEEVTNHLFEDKKVPFSGMDLISLNLQRARDHGVRPYNDYRVVCNLTRAKTFDDLSNEISPNLIARFKKIYEHVDDIDLFTGGISESPLHGGSVGPTFGCILGMQFKRLKYCDRFWHETDQPHIRFTEAQLNEIRKITLAKVICDNSDTINLIQKHVMDLPDSFLNPRISCASLPSIDLNKWKDTGNTCIISGKLVKTYQISRPSPCTMCACTNEGPVCNSIKVKNCFDLISTYSQNEILKDPVCTVQCSFAMKTL